jgi:hypothetical protein
MEDFESVAQGLRMPVPKSALEKNDHIHLSHAEAALVNRWPNSPDYNVLLRIMEGVLETLETEHMQSWKDTQLFERTGIGAVFARRFYEKTQFEINYHASEFLGDQAAEQLNEQVKQMSPEEMIRRSFGSDD